MQPWLETLPKKVNSIFTKVFDISYIVFFKKLTAEDFCLHIYCIAKNIITL